MFDVTMLSRGVTLIFLRQIHTHTTIQGGARLFRKEAGGKREKEGGSNP